MKASQNTAWNARVWLRRSSRLILVLAALTSVAAAQEEQSELLQLTTDEALSLGIRFEPIVDVGKGQGVTAVGQVISPPNEGSQLHSPVDGFINEWLVPLGEQVEKDTVLTTVRSAEAARLQGDWLAADVELQQAEQNRARIETLVNDGVLAARRLQQATLALRKAERVATSTASALEQIGFDSELRRSLADEGKYLGLALLRAPRAGRLVHQALRAEEALAIGDEVAELQSNKAKWLSLTVSAHQAQGAVAGSTLSLVNYPYALTLKQRDYAIDANTQTMELLAEFESSNVDLSLGALVDVVIEPRSGGLLIPSSSVVFSEGETLVYIQQEAGIEPRPLKLVPIGRDYSASAGVMRGERIAVSGTALLKGMQLGLGGGS